MLEGYAAALRDRGEPVPMIIQKKRAVVCNSSSGGPLCSGLEKTIVFTAADLKGVA